MDQVIVLSNVQNEQSARNTLQIALDSIGRGKDFQKSKAHQFLTLILNQIQSKDNSPKSKFYSIMMLKETTERGQTKILSVLSSHNLLKYLARLAKQTDPNKPITQKGKSLFDDKRLGNDYIRLVLECLRVWGEKFKNNKQQQPTKFRKFYNELVQTKVVLPTDFKFFNPNILGSHKQTEKKGSIGSVTPTGRGQYSSPTIRQGGSTKQSSPYDKDLNYSIQKIKTFIDILNTQEEYQQYIHKYHNIFTNQLQKYEKLLDEILSSGYENNTQTAIALNQFYHNEAAAYKQYITAKNDYYSYVQKIQIEAAKLGTGNGQSTPNVTVKTTETRRQYRQYDSRRNNLMSGQASNTAQNKHLVSELMSKLETKSKSPNVGFKAIKDNLSQDKSLSRHKRSTSGLKKSSVSKFGKSMSKSRIAQIFSNPPNPYPRDKRYQGETIEKHGDLSNVLRNISKHQGIRRFITANFKSKNPLFENTHLQIGLKSEPVYEQVNQFKVLISIELYIGNKTEDLIKNMTIDYKGNSDVILYGNPRTVDSLLEGGYQSKHQLLVIPLNNQFPFIKMHLKYTINGETVHQNITLPNSIIKLAHYRQLSKKQFVQNWNNSEIYRTAEFKLTRYIPPDALNKYITCLQELSSYQQFLIKGSQADFELGCLVILKQQFEGVLRIYIRPNLKAVIQIGILDNSQEAHQSFIFYAQTLQMLLTHTDHQL